LLYKSKRGLNMCDTIIVLGNSSEDGSIIFGKNSDRDPGEVHSILYIPHSTHQEGEMVHYQYLSIPQVVGSTHAVILAKPVWFKLGCEMGANEHGVVIGNEAVFSKEPYERHNVLLGMDLMTLALQRAKTASEALNVITDLLIKYGQGGVSSLNDPHMVQHNSYIIADLTEAWVLETANKYWVAKKVQDIATISNGYTIEDKWDLASPGLVEHALEKGWCDSKSTFNFLKCYSDFETRILSGCEARHAKTMNTLLDIQGQITISKVMRLLRSHDTEPFRPDKATMASVCAHYSSLSLSQTTGSYVAHLTPDLQTHWFTGTSAPCLSVFKPFFFESPEPLQQFKQPLLKYDNESLWWKHEKLHRLALMDYLYRAPVIINKSKELEQQLIERMRKLKTNCSNIPPNDFRARLHQICSDTLIQNFQLIDNLTRMVSQMEIQKSPRKAYLKFWQKLNLLQNM